MTTPLALPSARSTETGAVVGILDEALDRAERYEGADRADTRLAIFEMAIEGALPRLRRRPLTARRLSRVLDVANRSAGARACHVIVDELERAIEAVRTDLVSESLPR